LDTRELKRRAAHQAVEMVESGMVVGLGHGSTAAFATQRLAELLSNGQLKEILAIPCSQEVNDLAQSLGIRITSFETHPTIDLTIDGADEVDPQMDLIKGGGGALLREKIVASASTREIIIVDGSKLSPALGTRFALPVEVVPFAAAIEQRFIESLGAQVVLRGAATPFRTDQQNFILDCSFGPIREPEALASMLDARAGIVAHGLFVRLATDLIVADSSGTYTFTRGEDLTGFVDESGATHAAS